MCVNEISLWNVPWAAAAAREREIVGVYVNNRADWLSVSVIYRGRLQARWLFNFKVIESWCVYWYQDFICVCVCVCVCVTEKGWWGKSWPSWLNLTLPPHHHFQVRTSSYLVSLPHSALRTTRSILHALLIRPGKKNKNKKKTLLPGVWDFTGKKIEDTSDNVKQNPDHHFKKRKKEKKRN